MPLTNEQSEQIKNTDQSIYKYSHDFDLDADNLSTMFSQTKKNVINSIFFQNNNQQKYANNNNNQIIHNNQNYNTSYKQLIKEVFHASFLIIGGILISYLIPTITLHYIGQTGDSLATDTIGMSLSIINCCGGFFLLGVNQGFGSFAGRAFGSNNRQLLHNYFFKGLLLLLIILFLFLIFVLNLKEVLLFMGQQYDISVKTQEFLMGFMPGIFALYLTDFLKNYCNAQKLYIIPSAIQIITIIVHFFASKTLIDQYQVMGAIYSLNISLILNLCMLVIFMLYKQLIPLEFKFNQLFLNFHTFSFEILAMAAPNELDVISFEVNSILLGTLKNMPQFAAHISFINMINLVYATPLGIGAAFNYIISNAIGTKDIQKIKKCYKLNLILQCIIGIIYINLMYLSQDYITEFYSSNLEIQNTMKGVLHIYFIGLIPDYITASSMALLKGIGKANETIVCFLLAFYVVGIPSSVYFGLFQHLGVYGFWMGFDLAIIVSCISLTYLFIDVNWSKQIEYMYGQLQLENQKLIQDQNQNQDQNQIQNQDLNQQ